MSSEPEARNILWWIIGTLLAVLLLVGGFILNQENNRLTAIEVYHDGAAERLAALEAHQDDIISRLDKIDGKLDKIEQKIEQPR